MANNNMKYKIIISLIMFAIVLPFAHAEEAAKTAGSTPTPGEMIGAAPITDIPGVPQARPAKPGEALAPEGEKPAVAPTAPEPTTPEDYEIYTRKGHRDESWNEWIEPAFESFDEGNYATAAIFLKRAYEKGCRDPMVLFRLGLYKESRDEAKDAAQILTEAARGAARRYPKHPLVDAIHHHAGRALYKADRFKEALPHLKEALEHEPHDFMLLLMTGQIERMGGRKESARAFFEKALAAEMPPGVKPDPKSTVLGELIILTFDLDDLSACDKYIKMALAHDDKHKVANSYKGRVKKARFRKKELEIIKKLVE